MNDNAASAPRLAVSDSGRHGMACAMKPQGPILRVRRILPGESLGDVRRLRREVYFHEQGQQREDNRHIVDGLDGSGMVIVVESGAQAVGTLRIHDFGSPMVQVEYGSLFEVDLFARAWPLERIAVCTRFAVQADQRIKTVVDALVEDTYRHAQDRGIQFGLIACEPFLCDVFEHYGFREYLPPVVLPSGEALLRMALVVDDTVSLGECDSPLSSLVRHPAAGSAARGWLMRTFPEKTLAI